MPAPLLAAAAAAAPAIGAGLIGFAGSERTNAANAKLAREQMAFQERMSSSSIQRAVEDYKKAGLNPALAYGHGGASTPAGSSAQMEDSIGRGVSSAKSGAMFKTELATAKAQADLVRASGVEAGWRTQKVASEKHRIDQLLPLERAQLEAATANSIASAAESAARTKYTNLQSDMAIYDMPAARNRAAAADTWMGRVISPWLSDAQRARSLLPR